MDDDQLLPCPFCGSTHLSRNEWSGEDGEFPAIECDDCLGSAPEAVWNVRAPVAATRQETPHAA